MLKTDRILALDIGASSIKLAEFAPLKSGGIELTNYGVASLGLGLQNEGQRSQHLVTTIKEIMRDRDIRPGPVLLSVSGQSVFQRFVKLPPVAQEKIFQIVQYEAQQNVPFPINEVVWDYQLIGGGTEGEIDVMLAAIKAEMIEEITDAVESAGMVTDLVDVAPLALYNAVRYNHGDLTGCTLVIDIGARSTDLIFIDGNRFFCRSVPVAGNAITQNIMQEFDMSFEDAEELKRAHAFVAWGGAYEGPKSEVANKVSKITRNVMTRMHAEINRSINFYRGQQSGNPPSRALLTGGTAVIPYTDTFLKDKLKIDVEFFNPFMNVAVSEGIPSDEIGRYAYVLGETVGLGLRRALTCPIEINLMPHKVVEEKAFKKKEPILYACAIGIVAILLVWCGYFARMTNLNEELRDEVKNDVDRMSMVEQQLTHSEQQVANVTARIDSLHTLILERAQWVQVLNAIHDSLPEGMWITAIDPQEPGKTSKKDRRSRAPVSKQEMQEAKDKKEIKEIKVSGLGHLEKMKSANPIRDFRDALRGSDLFKDGEETRITLAPTPGPTAREFTVVVTLEKPISL